MKINKEISEAVLSNFDPSKDPIVISNLDDEEFHPGFVTGVPDDQKEACWNAAVAALDSQSVLNVDKFSKYFIENKALIDYINT